MARSTHSQWLELTFRASQPLYGIKSQLAITKQGGDIEIIFIQVCEVATGDRVVWRSDQEIISVDVLFSPAPLSITVRRLLALQAALEMARQLTADDPQTLFTDSLDLHRALDNQHLEWSERLWQRYKSYRKYSPRPLFRKHDLSARATYPPITDEASLLSRVRWLATQVNQRAQGYPPNVTVVIPTFGELLTTLRCLESILSERTYATDSLINISIVVVDDASVDGSYEKLRLLDGKGCIQVIRNEANLGYLRSCNAAAVNCKTEFICLLNNDTLVDHCWLDHMVQTFKLRSDVGIVGAKLLYPNRQLQEAGGAVWASGNAWNIGRGQRIDQPEFRYAREVDYVSGAALMIRQSLFCSLGGYDERYAPAYYEDIDLAFAAREKGYRVFVQPQSQVIHLEGISHGRDEESGIKSNQKRNREIFIQKWKSSLCMQPDEPGNPRALPARNSIGHILVLDNTTPTPDQDAGSIFIFNIIIGLLQLGYKVSFCPVENLLYMPDYSATLEGLGIQVLTRPAINSLAEHLTVNSGAYDAILIHRPEAARLALPIIKDHAPHIPLLFYAVDLHYLRMRRHAQLNNDPQLEQSAEVMKQLEAQILNVVDATIYVSDDELKIAEQELKPRSRSFMIPPVVGGHPSSTDFQDRDGIVFCGSFAHAPNRDAVLWFAHEVMPRLRETKLNITFHVVGANPQDDVQALACDDIVIHGYIEDLDRFIAQRRVSVAPLRFGAGIKGKVLHTLAAGLPIVASSIACEGLNLCHLKNVMLADGAAATAAAIAELYESSLLWKELSLAGQEHIKNGWSMEVSMQRLNKLLQELQLPGWRDSVGNQSWPTLSATAPFSYYNGMFKRLAKNDLLADYNL